MIHLLDANKLILLPFIFKSNKIICYLWVAVYYNETNFASVLNLINSV